MALAVAAGAYAQHEHHAMPDKDSGKMQMAPMFENKEVGMAYASYIVLKDALAASSVTKAREAASELEKSMVNIENGAASIIQVANITASTSLDEQRTAFGALSDQMAVLVKGNKLSMGTIYLDYCPMAKYSWLSNSKEIKNPYYGEKMLSCGSVTETIE
ncbi:MAG: DUF3347 domain-containing protein [Cyclobacteriaceae bacterium]|nr:DUF3347 domain-containing protein [Cyclobacteriaceae bacterium SS2]